MAQNLELFFAKNKVKTENQFFAATKSLNDEDGHPLTWELRKIPIAECEDIRADCTVNRPIPGKRGMTETKFDAELYTRKLVCASVVFPPLGNADLQDSYGVKTPEELLMCLVDDLGEWSALQDVVMRLNGLTTTMDEKVAEAKNL